MDKDILKTIQIAVIIGLVGSSVGYVIGGSFFFNEMNDFQQELLRDYKLIVVAGTLAAFALIGMGRRASSDKPS